MFLNGLSQNTLTSMANFVNPVRLGIDPRQMEGNTFLLTFDLVLERPNK